MDQRYGVEAWTSGMEQWHGAEQHKKEAGCEPAEKTDVHQAVIWQKEACQVMRCMLVEQSLSCPVYRSYQ